MQRTKEQEREAFITLSQPLSSDASRANETKVVRVHIDKEEDVVVTFNVNWNVGVGGSIWAAGMLLCNHMASRIDFFREQIGGKRVLELGSGIGFPGLLAAQMCSPREMVLTDLESHIELLAENTNQLRQQQRQNMVATNYTTFSVSAYDWNEDHTSFGKFDVILGSDLVYNPALYPLLIKAVLLHSDHHTVTYLGVTKSDTSKSFFKLLTKNNLEFYRIPDWEMEGKSDAGSTRNFGIFAIFLKRASA